MGDEFQQQGFRCRKGEGAAGCGHRPCFEIGQIRGQCAQGVFAHAFIDQMARCLDILIRQNLGQPVTAVHRQNGCDRVELFRPALDIRRHRGWFGHSMTLSDSRLAENPENPYITEKEVDHDIHSNSCSHF